MARKTKKYYRFDLNAKTLNILASILYIIFFIWLFNRYDFSIDFIILLIFIIYLSIHEICHGLGFSLFAKNKKNIKYGVVAEKGIFYALCQEEINRTGILISLMFPILILTVIPLIINIFINNPTILFLAMSNLIGAIGDIFLIILVLKLPKDITYIDFDNNIGAYFICDKDISKVKSFGLKCEDCGNYDKSLIDKSIPFIYISSPSKKFFVFFFILLIVLLIIYMI